MKIAILTADNIADLIALRAIDHTTIPTNRAVGVKGDVYMYYPLAVSGEKPDSLDVSLPGRWKKRKESSLVYSMVEDNYDFVTNSSDDVSSIEFWDSMGIDLGVDYGVIHNEITKLAKNIGWATLSTTERNLVGKYYGIDLLAPAFGDIEIVTHYAVTLSMTAEDAAKHHTKIVGAHINRMSVVANRRASSDYVKETFLYYLKDHATINNLTNSIHNLEVFYRSQYLLGEGRGDTRVGLIDFFENTGSYVGGGGVKDYDMNQDMVDAYIDATAVDPANPTQAEIDAAQDYVRNEMVTKVVGKLVDGKEL